MKFSGNDSHSEHIFDKLGIMPYKKRLLYNCSLYIFKALNCLSSFYSKKCFRVRTNRVSGQNSNLYDLEIPFTRLTI